MKYVWFFLLVIGGQNHYCWSQTSSIEQDFVFVESLFEHGHEKNILLGDSEIDLGFVGKEVEIIKSPYPLQEANSTDPIVESLIQTAAERISKEIQPNYFFFGDELWDAELGRSIQKNVLPNYVITPDDQYYVLASPRYSKNAITVQVLKRSDLSIHKEIKIPGYLSWDRTHCLEIIDRDLWRSDIDYASGQLINKRQVTTLGIFGFELDYKAWVGDELLFSEGFGKSQFMLNTKTGDLRQFSTDLADPNAVKLQVLGNGPILHPREANFGRELQGLIVAGAGDTPETGYNTSFLYIFSIQKGIGPYVSGTWLTNRHILTEGSLPPDPNSGNFSGPRYAAVIDVPTGNNTMLCQGCQPSIWSPDYSFALEVSFYGNTDATAWIWNIRTGEKEAWHNAPRNLSLGGDGQYLYPIVWISTDKFMYVSGGDLTTQGTYVYDVSENKARKLFSYKADSILGLPGSNYAVFIANEKLYRLNQNTNEVDILLDAASVPSRNRGLLEFSDNYSQNWPSDRRFIRK